MRVKLLRQIIRTTYNHLQKDNQILKNKKHNHLLKKSLIENFSFLCSDNSKLEGLDKRKISSKRVVKVRKFPGAITDDMYHYLMLLLQKQPDNVILHVGTNDASSCNSSEIANN